MTLKIAIQLDPVESLNKFRDSTLAIAYEALKRGHEVCYYIPDSLSFVNGVVQANCRSLQLSFSSDGFHAETGAYEKKNLSGQDVVLIRQDPPFNMEYITKTHFLDYLTDHVLVLNNPTSVRNSIEKLLPLEFPDLIPETLITQDWSAFEEFCKRYHEVIIKPLYDFGGHSVLQAKPNEGQLKTFFQLFSTSYPGLPVIVQPFIPDVIKGDKRIIMIDGEFVGGFSRIPEKGEIRSNMLMGGAAHKSEINARDLEICHQIGPRLKELGLFFVGIDVIGNYLIEINVTSPTGIVPLKELEGIDAAVVFWDKAEQIIRNKSTDGRQYYNSSVSRNRCSTH